MCKEGKSSDKEKYFTFLTLTTSAFMVVVMKVRTLLMVSKHITFDYILKPPNFGKVQML